MNATQRPKLTVAQVRAFARSPERAKAIADLALARAFAKAERERVDSYIAPIFSRYEFFNDREVEHGVAERCRLTKVDDLYLSKDEALFARFDEECSDAHLAHGWTGKRGYCPALVAEHAVTKAENALLAAGARYLGPEFAEVYGDMRERALTLLTEKLP